MWLNQKFGYRGFNSMRFGITGIDAKTGNPRSVVVKADSEREALALAKDKGVFPTEDVQSEQVCRQCKKSIGWVVGVAPSIVCDECQQKATLPPPPVITENDDWPPVEGIMAKQWHYSRGGKQVGPVPGSELKQLAARGLLSPTDMVWEEGTGGWVPASSLKGLFSSNPAPVPGPVAPSAGPNASTNNFQYSELAKPNPLMDYLAFRRMITPIFIQIIFWIAAICCFLFGIYQFFDGLIPQERSGLGSLFGNQHSTKTCDFTEIFKGLLVMVIGPVFVRIYCEILILFFRMNETLTEIKANTEHHGREKETS
jgi:hypothetical protein